MGWVGGMEGVGVGRDGKGGVREVGGFVGGKWGWFTCK